MFVVCFGSIIEMKIVKIFEDKEYFDKMHAHYAQEIGSWFWGLSEDGEIYYKEVFNLNRKEGYDWIGFNFMGVSNLSHFTLREMKLLVKEFDHLLAFL